MRKLLVLPVASLLLAACGGRPASSPGAAQSTQTVFEMVSPSVVAILNDDSAQREEEAKQLMREIGVEAHAPKKVIDVSLRKEPMPHGTGFLIDGGVILTAAHVVHSPDQLKVTTKGGQTVPAELVHIDEVRDVAVLKPKAELKGVPALHLADTNPSPGRRIWALGHTGAGLWALAWGVSEGITSGVVEMLGAKLLLFDAPVYPGFSGGPVVMVDDAGKPAVVGVNHAILFTGGMMPVASISSASSVADIKEAVAKRPAAIEPKLAEFAKAKGADGRAELFVTRNLSVHKDPQMLTTAAISGNERTIETGTDDIARVPVVAMMFGLPNGKQEITFELEDPGGAVVETISKRVNVAEHERVSFTSADFRFDPKVAGRYDIIAKSGGKVVGRTDVWIEDPDDDEQPVDEDDTDDTENGEPRVDVVVASYGRDDPFALSGIRSNWVEWRYPRRVGFTWFARGSRGWTGSNVAISAFVLDEAGKIVGRGVGCIRPEIRPERPWQCSGTGGTPLLTKEGRYDVVFALNDRPIAAWPMEAMVRTQRGTGSAMEKWLGELRKQHTIKKHKPVVAPPPKPPATEKPAPKPSAATPPPTEKAAEKPAKPKPAKPSEPKKPGPP